MPETDSILLHPTAPFDFQQTLEYLADFPIAEGEQTIENGRLTRAIPVAGEPIAFTIQSTGTVGNPQLQCVLHSTSPLSSDLRETALQGLRSYLGLADNLAPFYEIAARDPIFEPIARSLYGYHPVRFPTPFEAACWAVLAQRNVYAVTLRMKRALVHQFGNGIKAGRVRYPTFPEPSDLAAASTDQLAAAVKNAWKVGVLRSVADAFTEIDENLMRTGSFDEARRWLLTIDGIGDWSAGFILLRGYGRIERAPTGDRKLLEAASRIYGGFLSPRDLQRLAEPYGVYQGCWAHYLRVISI